MRFLNNIYLNNIFWNFLNQFGKNGFQLIVTLILARLLTPDAFGVIAMVLILTQFAELIIDSGFLLGVVQVKDITQKELSSVFYLNIFCGLLCTCIIYFLAPLIAEIYNNDQLVKIARTLSISCVFVSFSVVQHGLMIREMKYRNRTIAQLISQVISGIIAVILAKMGYGVMALVYYSILQTALSSIMYWVQSSWRPDLSFSFKDLNRVWTFSSNILGVTLLGNIAGRVDLFLIGKFFPAKMLGFYSKGKDFSMLPATIGSEVVSLSLFPILSRLNGTEFNDSFKSTLKILIFLSSILFALLSINAYEITIILLGSGWSEASLIFQLYFIVAFFYMINAFYTSVINATGKSRLNLKKELYQAPIRIVIILAIYYIFSPKSTLPFIYFWIVYYIASNLYSQFLICKICDMQFWDVARIGAKYIISSIVIGFLVFILVNFEFGWLNLLTRSFCFVFLFGLYLLFSNDNIIILVKGLLKKEN